MATFDSPGFLTPSPDLVPTAQNFQSLYKFASWHLPDVKNALVKRFANESLTGMLEALKYEQGFSSDKHVWGEEGRMFRAYSGVKVEGTTGAENQLNIPGHALREKEVIQIYDQAGYSDNAIVKSVSGDIVTVDPYTTADLSSFDVTEASGDLFVFVLGAEQKKGGSGMSGGVTRDYDIYSTKPIIIPGAYEISGSDLASVGWLTDGQNPFWYVEDMEYDRERFLSNLEKQMILSKSVPDSNTNLAADEYGTAGLFEQLRERGNNLSGKIETYDDLKNIIKRLDKQSGERYNMFFTSRDQKFAWDEIFAGLNPNQTAMNNYGAFENGKDMALDLGFNGFTWGGYEFYAQTWKMLINPTALGSDSIPAASKVHGVMLPMGETMASTGAKYQDISQNSREAINYITMMYRERPGDSRKFKEWVTDGLGVLENPTSKNDKVTINYLTERMLRLAGANKAFMVEGAA